MTLNKFDQLLNFNQKLSIVFIKTADRNFTKLLLQLFGEFEARQS